MVGELIPDPFDRQQLIQDYLTAVKWSAIADNEVERAVFKRMAVRLCTLWINGTGRDWLHAEAGPSAAVEQPSTDVVREQPSDAGTS